MTRDGHVDAVAEERRIAEARRGVQPGTYYMIRDSGVWHRCLELDPYRVQGTCTTVHSRATITATVDDLGTLPESARRLCKRCNDRQTRRRQGRPR